MVGGSGVGGPDVVRSEQALSVVHAAIMTALPTRMPEGGSGGAFGLERYR